ncbi:MAG: hypothetical protein IJR49_04125 [Treponema sp.]|nr:hypothetical protein [Treponema sp.]
MINCAYSKKTKKLVKQGLRFFISLCCIIFFSCGLDDYYLLKAPFVSSHIPLLESEPTSRYFHFSTNDSGNLDSGTFRYLGTAVYYKIYDIESRATSDKNVIETRNTSTASNAASYMIDTLRYQELKTEVNQSSPLFGSTGDRQIYIRLTNFGAEEDFKAKIIDGFLDDDKSVPGIGSPRRNVQNESTKDYLSFDFGRTSENSDINKEPVSDDPDFSGGSSSDGKYYVLLYAVAVGRDETFAKYYSPVTYLGAVTIDSTTADN